VLEEENEDKVLTSLRRRGQTRFERELYHDKEAVVGYIWDKVTCPS